MRILVACEESQAVTAQLRRGGHEAYSCDLLPTSGDPPEWHIQADALEVAKMGWDMVIAFPPCTHLAVSGARWFPEKQRDGRQQMGIGFFLAFTARLWSSGRSFPPSIMSPNMALGEMSEIMCFAWKVPWVVSTPAGLPFSISIFVARVL